MTGEAENVVELLDAIAKLDRNGWACVTGTGELRWMICVRRKRKCDLGHDHEDSLVADGNSLRTVLAQIGARCDLEKPRGTDGGV